MAEKHQMCENYSLSEYTQLQRELHHQVLLDQHQQGKIILPPDKLLLSSKSSNSSSGESSSSENGSELASSDSDDEFNIDDYYFLQPVPTKQRRMLLRQSGVKKIEPVERDECKDIRSSREVCGCNCKVFCNPETCICSQAGIKCQVDRLSFPCGCSKDGCGNVHGRIEFNPIRVRTHFIHTLMRLELEKKNNHGLKGILKSKSTGNKCGQKSGSMSPTSQKAKGSEDMNGSPGTSLESNDNGTIMPQEEDKRDSDEVEEDDDEEDVDMYNSNEKGSCRDCQSSEISDIIMRESQFSMHNADVDSCVGPASNHGYPLTEEAQLGLPTVTNAGESLPQVMLFSDDEESYHAENTAAMFPFPKEDGSYSESSDCSSEGSTSGEDQLVYSGYQNYGYDIGSEARPTPGAKVADQESAVPSETEVKTNNSTTTTTSSSSNNNIGIPQPCQAQRSYDASNSSVASSTSLDQKYINTSNVANGYKLEPISEILNPIRFPCYSPSDGGTARTSMTWNSDYCTYEKNGGQPNQAVLNGVEKPQCPASGVITDFAQQNTPTAMIEELNSPNVKPQHFYNGNSCPLLAVDVKDSPSSSPGGLHSYNGSPQYMNSTAYDAANATDAISLKASRGIMNGAAVIQADQPKYHELKASSRHSPEDSIASSFFSTASQVAASLDLTNQNSSAPVSSFHLSSSQPSVTKGTDDLGHSETSDLYGLPPVQRAQPVASFDLPNSQDENKSSDMKSYENKNELTEMRSEGSSTDQSTNTQNFGEIIKESIVETVSAWLFTGFVQI